MSFYVTAPATPTEAALCFGPHETFPQAQTCARLMAKRHQRVMRIVTEVVEQQPIAPGTLADVYETLERFDWFYEMSDDHRCWRRGEAAKARLDELADAVPGGRELVDAYRAHIYSGDPWSTPKQPKPARPEE